MFIINHILTVRSSFCQILCISMTYWGEKLNLISQVYVTEMEVFTPPAALERPHIIVPFSGHTQVNATSSSQASVKVLQ